jgi:hypothetical protein
LATNHLSSKDIGFSQRNEYGGIINVQGLRKIDPPPEFFDSGNKVTPSYAQSTNKVNLNKQIFSNLPKEENATQVSLTLQLKKN